MPRTIISLEPDDKAWLMRKAERDRVPMTELVRQAVRQYRRQCGPQTSPFEQLLGESAGLWQHGDGLAYQNRLRREWSKPK